MKIPLFNVVTMLFVILLTILILVICCCSRFYLMRTNPSHPLVSGSKDNRIQKNDKLRDKFFKQFTSSLKRFNKSNKSRSNAEAFQDEMMSTCPICIEEYTGETKAIFMGYIKTCKHFYHFKCIWAWLEKNEHCPLCRNQVKLQESDIRGMSLSSLVDIIKQEREKMDKDTEKQKKQLDEKVKQKPETSIVPANKTDAYVTSFHGTDNITFTLEMPDSLTLNQGNGANTYCQEASVVSPTSSATGQGILYNNSPQVVKSSGYNNPAFQCDQSSSEPYQSNYSHGESIHLDDLHAIIRTRTPDQDPAGVEQTNKDVKDLPQITLEIGASAGTGNTANVGLENANIICDKKNTSNIVHKKAQGGTEAICDDALHCPNQDKSLSYPQTLHREYDV